MKTRLIILAAFSLSALGACCKANDPAPSTPDAPSTSIAMASPGAGSTAPSADGPKAAGAKHNCAESEFASCHTGKACARRGTHFVEPVSCHARAADACAAATCEHGCDIYQTEVGGPKLVLCAPNASSTGHMKRCGGLANWACAEDMTCVFPAVGRGRDSSGQCMPTTPKE